jgi:hypothetical protein
MEQALKDIKARAMKVAQKNTDTTPYLISCGTLIKIIQEIEWLECELDEAKQNKIEGTKA